MTFVVLPAYGPVASAGTVRDDAGDFAVALDEPAASFCVAVPAQPTDERTCSANDRAVGATVAAASGQGGRPIGLVIAHFEAWDEPLLVIKDAPGETESNQRLADSVAGGVTEGVRKSLSADAHVLDPTLRIHGEVLRIGGIHVVRAVVKAEHPSTLPTPTNHCKITYEVIAKDADYFLAFSFDLAHYDEAAAVAERAIAAVHASPGLRWRSPRAQRRQVRRPERGIASDAQEWSCLWR